MHCSPTMQDGESIATADGLVSAARRGSGDWHRVNPVPGFIRPGAPQFKDWRQRREPFLSCV